MAWLSERLVVSDHLNFECSSEFQSRVWFPAKPFEGSRWDWARDQLMALRSRSNPSPDLLWLSRVCTRCETIPPKDVFSRVLVIYYEVTQSILRFGLSSNQSHCARPI